MKWNGVEDEGEEKNGSSVERGEAAFKRPWAM